MWVLARSGWHEPGTVEALDELGLSIIDLCCCPYSEQVILASESSASRDVLFDLMNERVTRRPRDRGRDHRRCVWQLQIKRISPQLSSTVSYQYEKALGHVPANTASSFSLYVATLGMTKMSVIFSYVPARR